MLPRFDLRQPVSLDEAVGLLAQAEGSLKLWAGGTNIIPDLRGGKERGRSFLSLARLSGLRYTRSNGRIEVGCLATVNDLLRSADIQSGAPALHAAAKSFAGHTVRSTATVAGNICYGSPSADLLPALICLDAEVALAGVMGTRRLPLATFNTGYKQTALKPDELLTEIAWNKPVPGTAQLFYKLGLRRGDAISVVSAAATLSLQGRFCTGARIALGSVAPTVVRAEAAEKLLAGHELDNRLIDEAADAASAAAEPIDDLRASKEYRVHTARVLVKRLLQQAMKG